MNVANAVAVALFDVVRRWRVSKYHVVFKRVGQDQQRRGGRVLALAGTHNVGEVRRRGPAAAAAFEPSARPSRTARAAGRVELLLRRRRRRLARGRSARGRRRVRADAGVWPNALGVHGAGGQQLLDVVRQELDVRL